MKLLLRLMMMMVALMMMIFTRVEFGHGSVTTVVCRRHRAFEDRAGDDDGDYNGDCDGGGHGVEST